LAALVAINKFVSPTSTKSGQFPEKSYPFDILEEALDAIDQDLAALLCLRIVKRCLQGFCTVMAPKIIAIQAAYGAYACQ
jgi:hypothetical protein